MPGKVAIYGLLTRDRQDLNCAPQLLVNLIIQKLNIYLLKMIITQEVSISVESTVSSMRERNVSTLLSDESLEPRIVPGY